MMIETRNPLPNTVCVNREYAKTHNYDFQVISRHWCFDEYQHRFGKSAYLWCRPLVFMDALHTYQNVFYLDSDAYFTRPEMSIEDFLAYARRHQYFVTKNTGENTTFVGATDCGNFMSNGGIQYWRKTDSVDQMLTEWFLLYRRQFPFYWLRHVPFLSNHEVEWFYKDNREQGTFKRTVLRNRWMLRNEISLIRYGKDTWHLPYEFPSECLMDYQWTEDTYFLNHIPGNFDPNFRNEWVNRHIQRRNITCSN